MTEYVVPAGFGEAELTHKRSRFIGRVWHTETEGEAVARISETRERHPDATHNVYAYILRNGGTMRYSDDGEPHGTSGIPTLSVFRNRLIFDVCCVVTRYFGGTLLGTGGLARAYSQAAKMALDNAGISVMRMWKRVSAACTYSQFDGVRSEILNKGGAALNIDYGADVLIEALVPENQAGALREGLLRISAGTVSAEITGEKIMAVKF